MGTGGFVAWLVLCQRFLGIIPLEKVCLIRSYLCFEEFPKRMSVFVCWLTMCVHAWLEAQGRLEAEFVPMLWLYLRLFVAWR